jgi:O-antigen/teichoic acid export membrane protein
MTIVKKEAPHISAISNFLSSIFLMAVGIATGIIVTRSLGPELKGQYSGILLILTLYIPLLPLGYYGGVLYYGLKNKIDLKELFWAGFLLMGTIGLGAIPSLYLFTINGFFGSIPQSVNPSILMIALTSAPLILLNAYCERILRARHQFRVINRRANFVAVLLFLYFTSLLILSQITLANAVIGVLLSHLVILLLNIVFIVKSLRPQTRIKTTQLLKPWRYGFQAWSIQIVSKFNDRFDQVILVYIMASTEFGIYMVGVALSNMLLKLPSSYADVLFNQIAEREIDDAVAVYAKAQRITIAISALSALVLSIAAYPLIYLFYGIDFADASKVVIFYAPGLIFQAGARQTVKFYGGIGRPLFNTLIYFFGFIVSIPCYFVLIPKLGIVGAAIASSLAYSIAFFASFFFLQREFGVKISSVLFIRMSDIRYIQSRLRRVSVLAGKQ